MNFRVDRVKDDAFNRTDSKTLRLRMMAHTFGTESRIDLIDLFAFRNRAIWTLRFAYVAVDALVGDKKRHCR